MTCHARISATAGGTTSSAPQQQTPAGRFVRFGSFEADLQEGKLTKAGGRIRLQEQPFRILALLLEHPGELVTREEIRQRLWSHNTFVEFDAALNTAVRKLREALNDSAENPRFLETVPRRGYRFVAPVALPASPQAVASIKHRVRRYTYLWVVTALIIAGAAVAAFLQFQRTGSRITPEDTIVLADFANSTGDAVFDDTLKTALAVSLRQSPFLNVLADSKVASTLQQMTRPASTKLTSDVARELCQRVGSKAYIAGAIGSLGSEYVLELKAVNCQSGDTLAQEQVTATAKEKVLDALGEVASKLRRELGESLATVQKFDVALAQATTSSLEALKVYSQGLKAFDQGGSSAALPYDQRAIQLDPSFALAYDELGLDYYNLSEAGRAKEYFGKAFQLREHASEWERLAIAADYYLNATGELEKAAQTYEEWIKNYPRNHEAYSSLGVVYATQGEYQKADEITEQALRLSPTLSSYGNTASRQGDGNRLLRDAVGVLGGWSGRGAGHGAHHADGSRGTESETAFGMILGSRAWPSCGARCCSSARRRACWAVWRRVSSRRASPARGSAVRRCTRAEPGALTLTATWSLTATAT